MEKLCAMVIFWSFSIYHCAGEDGSVAYYFCCQSSAGLLFWTALLWVCLPHEHGHEAFGEDVRENEMDPERSAQMALQRKDALVFSFS